jgi:hypothetical protein
MGGKKFPHRLEYFINGEQAGPGQEAAGKKELGWKMQIRFV